ncbi:poly(A)-specific ribonuclease [Fistulifera solaris]|uniref:Poly(A)-specific ribonuclease n=1 Tax=Fistulifera solaris TaxID=1519565 RepID=A0A1Z5JSA5_FISSO|nr:poly(A)-specific ribonuclease [Fistulifera solaris]|eukprot:GAX16658.1 poly(A)-specific ribonuclease [Fistulifera solaris]
MVNVTRSNFIEQSNDLLDHLPTAAFIAIDEEMTGISIQNRRSPKDKTPSEQYPELKLAAERYAIIQLGVSLFHNLNGSWLARCYNFYLFPSDREVVLNPSTVQFLKQHNMNFDMWMKEGIPYQTGQQAAISLQKFVDHQKRLQKESEQAQVPATIQNSVKRTIELRRIEDIEFFARAMAALREWLDGVHEDGGTSFLLPPCNSYLRRALYENIEKEYPSLELESAGPTHPNQIRAWRLTPEEKIARKQQLQHQAWENLVCDQVGLWRVFEAITRVCRGEELDRSSVLFANSFNEIDWDNTGSVFASDFVVRGKIPLVVHNGFMDLCFLLSHFHSLKLPDELSGCKELIRSYFPMVYDTKVMATECLSMWSNDSTTLSGLFENRGEEQANVVRIARDISDQAHEAAYDAYMTGTVYLCLCDEIKDANPDGLKSESQFGILTHLQDTGASHDNQVRTLYARNKLYQMSLYTMDLEDAAYDPLSRGMLPEFTYRVSRIDPLVSTRDIIRCLSDLFDSQSRRVNFEIIWIDDTTFLVAASYRPPPPSPAEDGEVIAHVDPDETTRVLQEHGPIIFEVLRNRFKHETILTLAEHLDSLKNADEELAESQSIWSKIWDLFAGKPAKRRRLN